MSRAKARGGQVSSLDLLFRPLCAIRLGDVAGDVLAQLTEVHTKDRLEHCQRFRQRTRPAHGGTGDGLTVAAVDHRDITQLDVVDALGYLVNDAGHQFNKHDLEGFGMFLDGLTNALHGSGTGLALFEHRCGVSLSLGLGDIALRDGGLYVRRVETGLFRLGGGLLLIGSAAM